MQDCSPRLINCARLKFIDYSKGLYIDMQRARYNSFLTLLCWWTRTRACSGSQNQTGIELVKIETGPNLAHDRGEVVSSQFLKIRLVQMLTVSTLNRKKNERMATI